MIKENQILIIKPNSKANIEEELIDQELFIYDIGSDAVHCFNSGAALIWYLCDGTHDVESITQEIVSSFNLPEQQVLTQVQEIVTQFQTLGLLQPFEN